MDDITKIKALLEQNQKIIRFASTSVNLQSFEDAILQAYEKDTDTVHELRVSEKEFTIRFQDFKNEIDQSIISITKDGIDLCVKKTDVVSELKAELKIGKTIEAASKWFLVDTNNFKLTKTSLTFTGEVRSDSCVIGGWKINGNTMTGSSLRTGTVKTSYLRLGNAIADQIDCNPDNISGKAVTLTGMKALDDEEKDESTTTILGIVSNGAIYATNGWNDVEHGCPFSMKYNYINCRYLYLQSKTGAYSTKNRITCDTIESRNKGETWSDRRLKKNIVTIQEEKAESVMLAIEPVEFDIKKTGTHAAGYIAQDMAAALKKEGFEGIATESRGYYGIRYEELIAFRIAVIKRNQKKIEELRRLRNGN